MKETIVIQYTAFASLAAVDAFKDLLSELLADEGSTPDIIVQKAGPFELDGNQFRVVWMGGYKFESPDEYYTFTEQDLKVEVECIELDFRAYQALTAGRERIIKRSYRNALRGVYNMSVALNNGEHLPTLSVPEYVSLTLEAAVNAFPNSN